LRRGQLAKPCSLATASCAHHFPETAGYPYKYAGGYPYYRSLEACEKSIGGPGVHARKE
jgi:hypothetical protein